MNVYSGTGQTKPSLSPSSRFFHMQRVLTEGETRAINIFRKRRTNEHDHLFADQRDRETVRERERETPKGAREPNANAPTCHEIRLAAAAAASVVIHGLIVKERERERDDYRWRKHFYTLERRLERVGVRRFGDSHLCWIVGESLLRNKLNRNASSRCSNRESCCL